jgi:hypothetical protein
MSRWFPSQGRKQFKACLVDSSGVGEWQEPSDYRFTDMEMIHREIMSIRLTMRQRGTRILIVENASVGALQA